ncbi:MAG TPA: N-6 DNA methylase, partial [Candidatus Obscuribacterales bacterium]
AALKIDESGRPYIQKNRNGRAAGQFYTPPWVIRYCLNQALSKGSSKLISAIEEAASSAQDNGGADRMQFKMLDPACGTGNFLLGLIDCLTSRGMRPDEMLSVVRDSLYGIEIDGRAASLCRIGLLISLSDSFRWMAARHGLQAARAAVAETAAALRRHIIVSDTLIAGALLDPDQLGRPAAPGSAGFQPAGCRLSRGQASTLSVIGTQVGAIGTLLGREPPGNWDISQAGTFDLVVGNPPYISYGSRSQAKLSSSMSRFLRSSYAGSAEYKVRTHSIFQEIALRYARVGGRVAMLVPDAYLTGQYYEKLRRHILSEAKILSITEFPDDIIGDATVGRWCIGLYERKHPDGHALSTDYDVEIHSFAAGPERPASRHPDARSSDAAPAVSYQLPAEIMVSADRKRFQLIFSDMERDLICAVSGLPALKTVLRGHTGMRSLTGQASIVAKHPTGDGWQKGISSGSRVIRHKVLWDGTWLNVEPRLLFGGGFDRQVVGNPKLLVRQTADRIVAAYDGSGLYHLNNVHSFSPEKAEFGDRTLLWYLDGLMNSSFWLFLYQLRARECKRALAQIDIEMVESMPLPPICPDKASCVATLAKVACALTEVEADAGKNGQALLGSIDRAIDRLVYDLYGLTAQQIEHIEGICLEKLPVRAALPDASQVRRLVESLASQLQLVTGFTDSG